MCQHCSRASADRRRGRSGMHHQSAIEGGRQIALAECVVPAVLDGGTIGGNLPGHKKTDISVNGRNQMWIMTNDSYLSIVSKDCGPAELLVRARRAGDIEKVFPESKVTRNTTTDYLYRAILPLHLMKPPFAAINAHLA